MSLFHLHKTKIIVTNDCINRSTVVSAKNIAVLKMLLNHLTPVYQRWSRGNKARGQGQGHKKNPRPRSRTGMLEAKAKDQGPEVVSNEVVLLK